MIFLKILVFFIFIYYGFKFLARYLFPYLLKRQINRLNKIYNANNDTEFYNSQKFNEGDVSITKTKNTTKKKINTEEGEYIEYEEVK